ncbi:hypothetical protein AV530_012101 [Patagioenas fasciata monilis]|uniref:Uncharacterized protein n=1 Tax=Patagioenas fasciata monilis TaxID=372326 RepID=A0A1V4JVA2_PATFA|nr:hypothetical protein AV530_012101 [Patagioenas fasciata monilis]
MFPSELTSASGITGLGECHANMGSFCPYWTVKSFSRSLASGRGNVLEHIVDDTSCKKTCEIPKLLDPL